MLGGDAVIKVLLSYEIPTLFGFALLLLTILSHDKVTPLGQLHSIGN